MLFGILKGVLFGKNTENMSPVYLRDVLSRKNRSRRASWFDLFSFQGYQNLEKLVHFRNLGLDQLSDPLDTSSLETPWAK